jgi:uncharacterized protein YndB with AHSA1/START domain/uncharacterized glyoxalase superfamily protein PhnB
MTDANEFLVHRRVRIEAPPDVVFDFFAEPTLFAQWFGEGSTLELREGGAVTVVFPGGAEAVGEVLAFERPRSIRFTWGYPRENAPVEPGGSVVDVRLEPDGDGTQVVLEHRLPTSGAAEAHEGGWAYHLARLAAKAARERLRGPVPAVLAAWFAAWSREGDEIEAHLARAMAEDGRYRDDAVTAPNRAEVAGHIARCHAQMPGFALRCAGPLLHTADRVACRTELVGKQGPLGRALLVCRLGADGRIIDATGYFEDPVPGVSDGPLVAGAATAEAGGARGPDVEPHFWCADLAATRRFYEEALGFETVASFPADGEPTWHQLARGPVRLMLATPPKGDVPEHQAYLRDATRRVGSGGAVALYLRVDDADAAFARASGAKAAVVERPWNPPWGGRQFTVADPDGHWWTCTGPAG